MLLSILVFVLGLAVLYVGADWLVRGASSIALTFGIRPLVVGLTVVALGTSMPEFLLNLFAIISKEDSIAIGNIVGSNIANIALILGISALLMPLTVERETLRKEYPILLGATLLFWFLARDGMISRLDGAVLLVGLASFMGYLVQDARRRGRAPALAADLPDDPENLEAGPLEQLTGLELKSSSRILYVIGGAVALGIGARLMITSAVDIADTWGIDHMVVGLTIVAIGTSLPELAASILCVIRKEADMSVGNVIGSNLLNILFVVGLISVIKPLSVETGALTTHFPIMAAFTVALLPLAWTWSRISRIEGSLLLGGFILYMVYLIAPYL